MTPTNLTEKYIRFIYSSYLREHYNNLRAVSEIINTSQKNNRILGIGGELTWYSSTGKILQVLEGPALNIDGLINLIKKDKRHENIQTLACEDITKKQTIYKLWTVQTMTDNLPIATNKTPEINDFQIMSIIGNGGFSTVVKCINMQNNKYYAMKIMSKKHHTNNSCNTALSERNIWRKLSDCVFVNKLYNCLQDPTNVYFVMNYAPRGDLFDVVNNYTLGEPVCVFYFCEILCGLKCIHDNDIIYRDLKLENVLIDKEGHVLLTDFGISQHSHDDRIRIRGTPLYFSPEIITNKKIDKKNDIWSLGIVLFELTGSIVNWQSLRKDEMFSMIISTQLTLDTKWSENINNLLQYLTIKDYNIRPDCDSVISMLLKENIIDNWENVYNKAIPPCILPNPKEETTNMIVGFSL
tara:strand:+ start:727 stop:1956 length:1230 start_codon:yes stop_codon:yes gene_type:complete